MPIVIGFVGVTLYPFRILFGTKNEPQRTLRNSQRTQRFAIFSVFFVHIEVKKLPHDKNVQEGDATVAK